MKCKLVCVAQALILASAAIALLTYGSSAAASSGFSQSRLAHRRHARSTHHKRRRGHAPSGPFIHRFPSCPPNPYPGYPPSDPQIASEALLDANHLISTVRLPSGSVADRAAPTGSGLQGTANCLQSPDTAGYYSYWQSTRSPLSVIDWEMHHPPAGSTLLSEELGGERGVLTSASITFAFPPVPGVSQSRQLTVEAVPLADGDTALQVNTQVIWLLPRPASERVPDDVSTVTLTYTTEQFEPGDPQPEMNTQVITVSNPWQVAEIVALIDDLPVAQPGPPSSCPAFTPVLQVTFNDADGNPVADTDSAGCTTVFFSIGGQPQYELSADGYYTLGTLFGNTQN